MFLASHSGQNTIHVANTGYLMDSRHAPTAVAYTHHTMPRIHQHPMWLSGKGHSAGIMPTSDGQGLRTNALPPRQAMRHLVLRFPRWCAKPRNLKNSKIQEHMESKLFCNLRKYEEKAKCLEDYNKSEKSPRRIQVRTCFK